jgi:PQQ-like domain
VTLRTATRCWGLAISLGLLLPHAARSIAALEQAASKTLPYAAAWNVTIQAQGPPTIAIGPAAIVLAFAHDPLQARAQKDGQLMWSAPLPAVTCPVVGDGLVFVVSGGRLHALDELTGQSRWMVDLGGASPGLTWRPDWVLVPVGTEVRAYRSRDGAPGWSADVSAMVSSPVVVDGNLVLATLDPPGLAALDGAGTIRWKIDLDAAPGALAVAGGRLYFGAADRTVRAYREASGALEWSFDRMELVGRPVVGDHQVFVTLYSNEIRGLDRRIGNLRQREPLGGRPAPGLSIAGHDLLVPLDNGDFEVLDAESLKKKVRIASPAPREAFEVAAVTPDASRVYTLSVAVSGDRTLTAFERRPLPASR